jgi:hypothetical protein
MSAASLLARRIAFLMAALALLARGAAAQPAPCPALLPPAPPPPRDLAAMLAQLRQAVQARDAAGLRSLAAPGIRLDLGDAVTLGDLRLEDPSAASWERLAGALSAGCRPASRDAWECPGLGLLDPPAARGIAPEERVFVLGRGVALRAGASPDAPVLARLSCEVVAYDPDAAAEAAGWTPVRLRDGRRGHLASRFAQSTIGYRLMVERRDGAWRITTFLAGD